MNRQKTIKINISKLVTKNIATRQAIDLVKREVFALPNLKNFTIELDFADVDFISRSFADELINLRKQVKNKNTTIEFINTNNEVDNMLKIVSVQKASKGVKKINLPVRDLETMAYQF